MKKKKQAEQTPENVHPLDVLIGVKKETGEAVREFHPIDAPNVVTPNETDGANADPDAGNVTE